MLRNGRRGLKISVFRVTELTNAPKPARKFFRCERGTSARIFQLSKPWPSLCVQNDKSQKTNLRSVYIRTGSLYTQMNKHEPVQICHRQKRKSGCLALQSTTVANNWDTQYVSLREEAKTLVASIDAKNLISTSKHLCTNSMNTCPLRKV